MNVLKKNVKFCRNPRIAVSIYVIVYIAQFVEKILETGQNFCHSVVIIKHHGAVLIQILSQNCPFPPKLRAAATANIRAFDHLFPESYVLAIKTNRIAVENADVRFIAGALDANWLAGIGFDANVPGAASSFGSSREYPSAGNATLLYTRVSYD